MEKNTYGLKHERTSHWAGHQVSVEHTVTVETSQMSAFQFRSTTLRFSISLMKPTWDYVIVGSGLTTESLELKKRLAEEPY